jgi:hypothetical protein
MTLLQYITKIKQTILSVKNKDHIAINPAMIEAYWLIWKRIVVEEQNGKQRAEYRQEIIKALSKELKNEFGTGFGECILRGSRQFFLCFKNMEFNTHCMTNLTWSHCRLIIPLTDKNAVKYYLTEVSENNWSVRTLDRNILILMRKFWILEEKRSPQCPITQ